MNPLEALIEYEKNGGKILFWSCPNECTGYVEWDKTKDPPVATCKTCGRTSREPRKLKGER